MAIIEVRDDAHWHELRSRHIGGSDVAALFGMSHFSTKWQLWMEKSGKLPPEDLSENKNVQAGKFLEVGIAGWAASKWGMGLQKVTAYHTHETVAGMGATLDYATDEGIPVEIKWSARGHGWHYSDDTITHAPDNYILQTQHQMACFGGNYAWLVALIDNEPRRMLVPRNDAIITSIEAEVAEFWDSVAAGREPDPDFTADAEAIKRLVGQTPISDVTLDAEHAALFDDYLSAVAEAKAAETFASAAKAQLLMHAVNRMVGMNTSAEKAVVRCGDHKMLISTVAENPGKLVTQDMVGTRINARRGYQTVRIS